MSTNTIVRSQWFCQTKPAWAASLAAQELPAQAWFDNRLKNHRPQGATWLGLFLHTYYRYYVCRLYIAEVFIYGVSEWFLVFTG